MTKEELLDKIFQHLYDNPSDYWNISETAKQYFGVTDDLLITYVIEVLINENFTSHIHGVTAHRIKQDGRDLIEKHKSYSKYLKSVKPKREAHWLIKDISKGAIGFAFGVIGTLTTQYILSPKTEKENNSQEHTLQVEPKTEVHQAILDSAKADTIKH